jgi:hypothetical protein
VTLAVIVPRAGSPAIAPTLAALVPAVAHEYQAVTAAALACASGQEPLSVARTHRDKGNDADFNINLPALHDKSSCLGTVRSSRRSGRRSAVGLCAWLRTDHTVRHRVGRPPR